MHSHIITTERLLLRPPAAADAEAVFAWAGDPEVNRFQTYPLHTDPEQTRAFLLAAENGEDDTEDDLAFLFVHRSSGQIVGCATAWPEDGGVWELGYTIRRDCWGQGYASEGVRAVIAFAHETLGVKRFAAHHAVDNPASGRVLEKCGLVFDHMGEYAKEDSGVIFPAKFYRLELD